MHFVWSSRAHIHSLLQHWPYTLSSQVLFPGLSCKLSVTSYCWLPNSLSVGWQVWLESTVPDSSRLQGWLGGVPQGGWHSRHRAWHTQVCIVSILAVGWLLVVAHIAWRICHAGSVVCYEHTTIPACFCHICESVTVFFLWV